MFGKSTLRRSGAQVCLILTILLLILGAFGAYAAPSANFDLRQQLMAGLHRMYPSPVQAAALRDWQARSGTAIQARWNSVTGSVHHLFRLKGYLTPPQAGNPLQIALGFLKSNQNLFGLHERAIGDLRVAKTFRDRRYGTTRLVLHQYYRGAPVFGGSLSFNIDAKGRILSAGGNYIQAIQTPASPRLTPSQALSRAAANVAPGVGFAPKTLRAPQGEKRLTVFDKGPFLQSHGVGLTIFPVPGGARYAWQVIFHKNSQERYAILVDAKTGEILYRVNLVLSEVQGLVFEKDPGAGAQVLKSFAGDPVASPPGWVSGYEPTGNNVLAQEDWAGSNIPGYRPYSFPFVDFSYLFTNTWATSGATDPYTDIDAAITNLFYWNNLMHDYLYALGFDEAAGNFQQDNFGRGGSGGDAVRADAQDGYLAGNYNNANFYPPPDGADPVIWGYPRMQMYLFSQLYGMQDRDASFSADIIIHEYVHGLSNRLIGSLEDFSSLFTTQGGAMGEGWSDFLALSMLNDPVMGAYVTGDTAKGIRHYAYNSSPLTYADFGYGGGPEVHNDGEIWCAALYDLRQKFITAYGVAAGRQKVEQLVVDGMKFCVHFPDFLDARDAILVADVVTNNGANQNLIWQAFADRGMGYSASTTGPSDADPVAGFDLPSTTSGKIQGEVYRSSPSKTTIIDSPHPYPDNYDNTWTITGPAGATRMRIRFSQIETEYGYDFLYVTDGSGTVYDTASGSYSGYTSDQLWSSWVPGNVIKVRLVSDFFNWFYDYWGFRVDRYQAVQGISGAKVTLSESGGARNTDANGAYLFNSVTKDNYVATPSKTGSGWTFQPATRNIPVPAAVTVPDQDFLAYDGTPPTAPVVTDDGACTTDTTQLHATWTAATDPETPVVAYTYAIGTLPGGTDMVNWTMTPATSFTRTGLSLQNGKIYYIAVKARNEDGQWSEPGVSNGITVLTGREGLLEPAVAPKIGDTGTKFVFTVTYLQLDNLAPDYAYVAILQPDGTRLLKTMTTTDTTYADGSLYSYSTKLPVGTYTHYFLFKVNGNVLKTATYAGPVAHHLPTLSNPSLSPSSGNASTNFVFSVTYTQVENVAPGYAYVAIVKPDGSRLLKPMSTADTTYTDGSVYTCTVELPVSNYTHYFQFKGADSIVKTTTCAGPNVN